MATPTTTSASSTSSARTTAGMARRLADVADALADYEHLPALHDVMVFAGGTVFLSPDYGRPGFRTVAEWARVFDTPVVIDLSHSGRLFTVVQLRDITAKLDISISHRQAYELGAALGVPVSPGGQVQVAAADLLAVLDTGEEAIA